MKPLLCPNCKIELDLTQVVDRVATCAKCGRKYQLRPPQSTSSASSDSPRTSSEPQVDQPSGLAVESQQPEAPVPDFRINVAETEEDKSESTNSSRLAMLVVGGIALVTCGIFFAVWMLVSGADDRTANNDPATSGSARDESNGEDEKDPNTENVLDLSDLTILETDDQRQDSVAASAPSHASDAIWLTAMESISIPIGNMITIDGVPQQQLAELGLTNRVVTLPAPRGVHAVGLTGESVSIVRETTGFEKFYAQQIANYQTGSVLSFDKLAEASRELRGRYQEPILPHAIGNHFWQMQQPDAAIRHWKLAVLVSPSFAPAHLNLCFAAIESGDWEIAGHQWQVASALNVQDNFGIAEHLVALQARLTEHVEQRPFTIRDYQPGESLTGKPRQVVDALMTLRQFAPSADQRAACLNNVGVYLMREAGLPEQAFEFLQWSQIDLAGRADAEIASVASTIRQNLLHSAQQANLAEAELMQRIVASQ